MDLANQIMLVIWWCFNFVLLGYGCYMTIIGLYGFVDQKPFPKSERYHRFAAVICARNERTVIANLIESIKSQHYPEGLIDVIVVADNCTDDTAEIAKKAGAIVYERHNLVEVGKGYALRYFCDKVFKEPVSYDAFCFFDADNIVHPDYFEHMNRALSAGANVAQGYRDMKNPSDTWVSGTHSVFYWIQNRFGHNARFMLGLNAVINGTGFMMRSSKLREWGWDSQTITEDIELSCKCSALGEKIYWVKNSIVFDEQPLTFKESWHQRLRWSCGILHCLKLYGGKLLSRAVKTRTWQPLDMFLFIFAVPVMMVSIVNTALMFVLNAIGVFQLTLFHLVTFFLGMVFGCMLFAALAIFTEKKGPGAIKAVLAFPLFNLSWFPINIVSVFKKKVKWVPISHTSTLTYAELSGEKTMRMKLLNLKKNAIQRKSIFSCVK